MRISHEEFVIRLTSSKSRIRLKSISKPFILKSECIIFKSKFYFFDSDIVFIIYYRTRLSVKPTKYNNYYFFCTFLPYINFNSFYYRLITVTTNIGNITMYWFLIRKYCDLKYFQILFMKKKIKF